MHILLRDEHEELANFGVVLARKGSFGSRRAVAAAGATDATVRGCIGTI